MDLILNGCFSISVFSDGVFYRRRWWPLVAVDRFFLWSARSSTLACRCHGICIRKAGVRGAEDGLGGEVSRLESIVGRTHDSL